MAGSGDYVVVTEGHVDDANAGYIDGRQVLLERVDKTNNIADTSKERLDSVIASLDSVLSQIASPDQALALIGSVTIGNASGLPDRILQDRPSKPDLPGFEDVIFPIAPIFQELPEGDLSYTAPAKPEAVNPTISFVRDDFTSELWTSLASRIIYDVLNPGTGIDPAIENDVWERDRLRAQDDNDEAYQAATQDLGRRGLRFPQLSMRAVEQRASKIISKQNREASLNIAIKQSELAQQNRENTMTRAISLDQAMRDSWKFAQQLDLDHAKAGADLILQNYAEGIKGFLGEWEGIVSKLKAYSTVYQAIATGNSAKADIFRAQTDGATARTEQISKERSAIVESYKVDGDVYLSAVKADADWFNAKNMSETNQTDRLKLKLDQVLQKARAIIDLDLGYNQIRERVLEALGGFLSQLVASSLATVHTQVGHSTSKSADQNESWSHHDSISDGYSLQREE